MVRFRLPEGTGLITMEVRVFILVDNSLVAMVAIMRKSRAGVYANGAPYYPDAA